MEIQTDATMHFDEEKLSEYMTFLKEEQGIDECFQFFNYAMGLKSQFLSVLVLYHSYNNNLNEVNNDRVNKFSLKRKSNSFWFCQTTLQQ